MSYLLEDSQEAQEMRLHVMHLLEANGYENLELALQLIEGGGLHTDFENPLRARLLHFSIDDLPNAVGEWRELAVLWLDNNRIVRLPASLLAKQRS